MKRILLIALFAVSCSSAPRYYLPSSESPVIEPGLSVFLDGPVKKYRGKRCALLTNQSGVTPELVQNLTLLRKAGLVIPLILVPEHGLFSSVDWPNTPSADDSLSRGETLVHIQSMNPASIRRRVEGLDAVIYDIQCMGMRCFTYISELSALIDALDGTKIELVVLDRPNPLIPYGVDGIMQDPKFRSRETGYFPSPMNYALTPGEAASYYLATMKRKVKLRVIPMKGYDRDLFFSQTGLPWVPPSPNLPDYENAVVYSSAVYFEGTNLSVGRGTSNPFKYLGAPWIDAEKLCAELSGLGIRGFAFRPIYFRPSASIYSGRRCGGVQIFLTGEKFSAYENAYRIMACIKKSFPQFRLMRDGSNSYGLDILAGSDLFRSGLDKGLPFDAVSRESEPARDHYRRSIRKFYIY